MKFRILLLISSLFLIACNNSEISDRTITYFDLKTFFEKECERLNKENPIVYKIALNNEKTENKIFTNVDWNKELTIFIESDINKSAWKNSYTRTLISDSTAETITYRAVENSLPIRYISIIKDPKTETVREIEVRSVTINNLYRSTQVLKYMPDSMYYIIGTQKVQLMDENRYGIIGHIADRR